MRHVPPLVFALLSTLPCAAQTPSGSIVKGTRVALRVPPAAFGDLDRNGLPQGIAEVVRSDGGISINGIQDWAGLGFGLVNSVRIADVKADTKTGRLKMRLDRKNGGDLNLSIPLVDTSLVFSRLFAPASDTVAVQAEIREAVRRRVFSGAMASVSPVGQARLLMIVNSAQHSETVNVVPFQGRPHLEIWMPETPPYPWDNETTKPQMQAWALQYYAIPIARQLGASDSAFAGGFGFAILVTLRIKGPLSTAREDITVFVPADAAALFADAQITSQELVDRSAVMVRGNRVKVDLLKVP